MADGHAAASVSQNILLMDVVEKDSRYRNASVVMLGVACLILFCHSIFNILWKVQVFSYGQVNSILRWLGPVSVLVTPIFFGWVAILLRKRFPSPSVLVKTVLVALIPALYLFWTFMHLNGCRLFADGARCIWLFTGILCYLIPVERLEKCKDENGFLDLLLFLASAFCSVGVERVVSHFSVSNFQMLTGQGTKLFCRAMLFIPLAMSVFFLARFAFSRAGQKLGRVKAIGWTVQVISVIYFLSTLFPNLRACFYCRTGLYRLYKLLVQPVSVYLIVVFVRILKKVKKQGCSLPKDIF